MIAFYIAAAITIISFVIHGDIIQSLIDGVVFGMLIYIIDTIRPRAHFPGEYEK